MPVSWSISHDKRLVCAQAHGEIKIADIKACLDDIAHSGALPYGKLIDVTFAPLNIDANGLRTIGQYVTSITHDQRPGPVAIVSRNEIAEEMLSVFNRQASVDRPLRVFREIGEARQWLAEVVTPAAR